MIAREGYIKYLSELIFAGSPKREITFAVAVSAICIFVAKKNANIYIHLRPNTFSNIYPYYNSKRREADCYKLHYGQLLAAFRR